VTSNSMNSRTFSCGVSGESAHSVWKVFWLFGTTFIPVVGASMT